MVNYIKYAKKIKEVEKEKEKAIPKEDYETASQCQELIDLSKKSVKEFLEKIKDIDKFKYHDNDEAVSNIEEQMLKTYLQMAEIAKEELKDNFGYINPTEEMAYKHLKSQAAIEDSEIIFEENVIFERINEELGSDKPLNEKLNYLIKIITEE